MNLFFPRLKLKLFPRMLLIALFGAGVAGFYGILHDQITFTISPEYFTKMKFHQFHYADFGLPQRVFVAEIGVLATWWVGLFAGWFLARIAVPVWPAKEAWCFCLVSFAGIFGTTLMAGVVGFILGVSTTDYANWLELCQHLEVKDVAGFVRVAYIHNASYLGGLIGLIATLVFLVMKKRYAQRLLNE